MRQRLSKRSLGSHVKRPIDSWIVGILCVLAVRLLMMKTIAKQEPDRPAIEVAPKEWVDMVCGTMQTTFPNRKENWQPQQISIRDFLRGLAMMGGFLARKHDGEPEWLTIWNGVKELVIKLEVRRNT